jgi:cellulose biosynthesis protein BcsQ
MNQPIVTFFNNKGGVGKTSLVFHVSWMAAELGIRVLVADLDPQANLTSAYLSEAQLEEIWPIVGYGPTVYGALEPLLGVGDIHYVKTLKVSDDHYLLRGDIALSQFEDELAESWPACLTGRQRPFHITSALWRLLRRTAERIRADLVLVDVGPNLGALNRAVLVATDHVVIPMAPDLFSVQGLRNLGPSLRSWGGGWRERLARFAGPEELALPEGAMRPAGYVLQQHGIRAGRPTLAYQRWMDRVPSVYRSSVLDVQETSPTTVEQDDHCLAQIKNYRSLVPMAQEARKPVFALTAADGAFGGHQTAARQAYTDFRSLTMSILRQVGVPA